QTLGLSKQEVRRKFDEIVDFSGIGEFIIVPMSAYSSGLGSQLRFAISTAAVPDILVVDDELGTGDAELRNKANERIAQIRESASTIFMVSHNNATIKRMCTLALWLEQWHVIMDGPSGQVVDAYATWVEQQQALRAKAHAAKARQAREQEPTLQTPEDQDATPPTDRGSGRAKPKGARQRRGR